MADWSAEAAEEWVLKHCFECGARLSSGLGIALSSGALPPGAPPWSIVSGVVQTLQTDQLLVAEPAASLKSHLVPLGFERFRLTRAAST